MCLQKQMEGKQVPSGEGPHHLLMEWRTAAGNKSEDQDTGERQVFVVAR